MKLFSRSLLLSLVVVVTGIAAKCDSDQCTFDVDPTSITVFAPANTDDAMSPVDLSFIHAQLIKDLLLTNTFDEQLAAKNFVEFYKEHDGIAAGNDINALTKFKSEYNQHSAIWWYTHPGAIHQLLNEALRTQDVLGMLRMGFFVQRLHRQIEHLAKNAEEVTSGFVVYRGQGLSFDDYGKVKEGEGGMLSFNTFLMAESNREEALATARRAVRDGFDTAVLLCISIEPSMDVPPTFTSLDHQSYFDQSENEYLFSLPTVFRIEKVEKLAESDGILMVHLRPTTMNDRRVRKLMLETRNTVEGFTPMYSLGKLVKLMARYSTAEVIYNQLLNELKETDLTRIEIINHELGRIQDASGNLAAALASYERAFEVASRHRLPNDSEFARILTNMGGVLLKQKMFDAALKNFQEALRLEMQSSVADHPGRASIYNNIAITLENQGRFHESVLTQELSIALRLQHSLHNHDDLSISYLNLAFTYHKLKNYTMAISYFEKSLLHQYQAALVNWKTIALVHYRLVLVFKDSGNSDKAIHHAQQAVEVAAQIYSKDDVNRRVMEAQLASLLNEDL